MCEQNGHIHGVTVEWEMLSVHGYRVPKKHLQQGELRSLCRSLTLKPFSAVDIGWIKPVSFYHETRDDIYVPRHFGEKRWGTAAWGDADSVQRAQLGAFCGNLRTLPEFSQQEACDVSLGVLRKTGGCILSLYTGGGKTTCALWIAHQLGLKTAVVVHKDPLMAQWEERIHQFLPEARVGVLRGDSTCVHDSDDFTLCMIQSLLSPTRSHEGLEKFGLVILDEVHHVAARMFSRVFTKLTRPYMLGLSATVERKDRLHETLGWFVGPVSFAAKLSESEGVMVRVEMHTTSIQVTLNKRDQVNFSQLITDLTMESSRNEMVVRVVSQLADRSVLVLSDRRAHCQLLHGMCNVGDESVLLLAGSAVPSKRYRLYFGTYALMAEGVDIPHLDTLVMATPRADVRQSVGRILRAPGPKVVVDIVDKLGPLFAQFRKRRLYYKSSGFRVGSPPVVEDRPEQTVTFV